MLVAFALWILQYAMSHILEWFQVGPSQSDYSKSLNSEIDLQDKSVHWQLTQDLH
jgi:hypothetical protein